jgi:hypothetical protein
MNGLLDVVLHLEFQIIENTFWKQDQLALSKGLNRVVSPFLHLRMETDPVSETLYFLLLVIPDNGQVQKPSNSVWFRHSQVNTYTEEGAPISPLIFFKNKEIMLKTCT